MTEVGLNLAVKVAFTAWLVAVSVWDRLQARVPNYLVLPVMFGAMIWRLYAAVRMGAWGPLGFAAIAWVVLYALWLGNVFGGGDAKLLMALFAAFPTIQFLVFFSIVVLLVSMPMLIIKYAKQGLRTSLQNTRRRLAEGRLLPTAEQLRSEGRPHCWSLALPGVIYLWLAY